jgi:hypothetical protein
MSAAIVFVATRWRGSLRGGNRGDCVTNPGAAPRRKSPASRANRARSPPAERRIKARAGAADQLSTMKAAAIFFSVASLLLASVASAEQVVLRPRHRAGDSYALSLGAATRTDAFSRSRTRPVFSEDVDLRYRATVVVLETDGKGRPTRERHLGVALAALRPDGSDPLFADGTTYEVRRDDDGDVRVFVAGRRIERRIERVVARLLEDQFEFTSGPDLLDPGRPVSVGESWRLESSQVRRFLRERGVRVVELGAPATATLVRRFEGDDSGLVVHYEIPLAWFELDRMPANARTARSEGRLAGDVRLASPASGQPVVHTSSLELRMNGIVGAVATYASPWSLASTQRADQRTRVIADRVASAVPALP